MQPSGTKAFFSKTSAKEAFPIVQTTGQLYDRCYDLCSLVGLVLPYNLHLSCLECVNAIDTAPDAKCCVQISLPSSVTMHTTPESEGDEEAEPLHEADAGRHDTLLTLL